MLRCAILMNPNTRSKVDERVAHCALLVHHELMLKSPMISKQRNPCALALRINCDRQRKQLEIFIEACLVSETAVPKMKQSNMKKFK